MKPAIYQSIKIELEMLESKKLEEYKLVGFIENLIFNGFLIMDNNVSCHYCNKFLYDSHQQR